MSTKDRNYSPQEILHLFHTIGIAVNEVTHKLFKAPTPQAAQEGLKELQAQAKQHWLDKAFTLHPDRGGDEEQFKSLKQVHDAIQDLNIRIAPKPRVVFQQVVIRYQQQWGGTARTNSATTDSWW